MDVKELASGYSMTEFAPEELSPDTLVLPAVAAELVDEDAEPDVAVPLFCVAPASSEHLGVAMTMFTTKPTQVGAAAEIDDSSEVDQSLTLDTHA